MRSKAGGLGRQSSRVRTAHEGLQVEALEALVEAGRRLRDLDPGLFNRILAVARAAVAAYERPDESGEVWAARIAQGYGKGGGLLS